MICLATIIIGEGPDASGPLPGQSRSNREYLFQVAAVIAACVGGIFAYLGDEPSRMNCLWTMTLFLVIASALDILGCISGRKG